MNHLAHLLLAEGEPGLVVGAFLGDHVKGRLHGLRPADIERGIRLHRAIDAFTDAHATPLVSRLRFEKKFRRYGSIMTDVIYDHFLANSWTTWHPQSLADFSETTFQQLLSEREHFSDSAIKTCERMYANNALVNYLDPVFIERSLSFLSSRFEHENPLAEGFQQFVTHQENLAEDFATFFPALRTHSKDWIQANQ